MKKFKSISFISGSFITAHLGHIRLFKYANEFSDNLVVGVFSDKLLDFKCPVNEKIRIKALKKIKYISKVVLIDVSLKKTILSLNPNFIIKGSEFRNQKNEEKIINKNLNTKLIFFEDKSEDVDINYIIENNIDFFNSEKLIKFPSNFIKNHNIKIITLKNIINKFRTKKICVVGDLIVDKYVDCEEIGVSQEDSSLVVRPFKNTLYVGGAGIVASHAANLGAKVDLFTKIGSDKLGNFANQKLNEFGVNLINPDSAEFTISKIRYLKNSKILFRVNNVTRNEQNLVTENKFIKNLKNNLKNYDLIILSDFNYGCITLRVVKEITKLINKKKIIIVGDSQSSSQKGDITKFNKFDLVTATEFELRSNLNDFKNNITFLANKYIKTNKSKNIIIKLGKNGIFIHSLTKNLNIISDSLDALNLNPVNVSGAGDAFLVISSLSLSTGANIWESSLLGSLSAALQISRRGNIPITYKELLSSLS